MDKIMLFKKADGSVWYDYRGMQGPLDELNIALLAQLYKQTGQMPMIGFPKDDVQLSILAKTLKDNIQQTAIRLMF